MRIGWILIGLAACGADATPPQKPVAPAGDPAIAFGADVSLPASTKGSLPAVRFGHAIRVRGTKVEQGGAEVTDTSCRGAKAVGTREPPQRGDTVVFIDATAPARLVARTLESSTAPTVLAVRKLGAREVAILPYRFCGHDETAAPASTVDVGLASGKLTIAPASGTGTRVTQLPLTSSADELGRNIRTVAANRPIERLRVSDGDVPAQHLFDVLDAALVSDIPAVELGLAADAGLQLGVVIGGISAAKHVDPARVRQALVDGRDALLTCYEHAAFENPELGGTVSVPATVAVGGKLTVTVPEDIGEDMATCVRATFEAMTIEGVRKPGRFTATLELTRSPR